MNQLLWMSPGFYPALTVGVLTGLWANPAVQWLHLWPNFVVCISSLSRPTSAAHPMGGVHGHGLLDRGAAPWAKPTGKHHGQTRPANALVCMRVRARLCLRVNANASGWSSPRFFSFDHSWLELTRDNAKHPGHYRASLLARARKHSLCR